MTIHWTKLKKAVEEAGGAWTTREEAESFLDAIGKMPAEEVSDAAFDPDAPYGQVSGEVDGAPGAYYCQGDAYFNKAGKKVG